MILDEYVEVGVSGIQKQYYIDLGYKIPTYTDKNGRELVKNGTKIMVKVEDLKPNSTAKVHVTCDECGKQIYTTYQAYLRYSQKNGGKYYCQKCNREIYKKTIQSKYGVNHISQVPEVKEKIKKTLLEHYNVDNPAKSKDIQKKIKNTNLIKYGVENPMQSQMIRNKAIAKMYENQTQACSSQQLFLGQLYNAEINYPFGVYSLDLYIENERINIEYDGGGHDLSVKLGNISKDDFYKKQMIREKYERESGIRIIRIISPHDKLPTSEKLLEIYYFAMEYFKTNHTWINFYIEENKYRNAEHIEEDGAFYDFGELWNGKSLANKEVNNE